MAKPFVTLIFHHIFHHKQNIFINIANVPFLKIIFKKFCPINKFIHIIC